MQNDGGEENLSLATERQHVRDQLRRPLGCVQDQSGQLAVLVPLVGIQLHVYQIGGTHDVCQHIVEIVGHPAGEFADRLHLVNIRQLFDHRIVLGPIAINTNCPKLFVIVAEDDGGLLADRNGAAIGGTKDQLPFPAGRVS